MLGVTATKDHDQWLVIISGLAGALDGASSMAAGELVSVSSQRDIERITSIQKPNSEADKISKSNNGVGNSNGDINTSVATPKSPFMKLIPSDSLALLEETLYKPAGASALISFPSAVRAMAVSHSTIRVVASISLAVFGGVGAYLGGSSVRISAVRILVGGWISMAITYIWIA